MTINELQSSILVYEQRIKGHKEEEQALKVPKFGRSRGRDRGRGRDK